MQNRAFRAGGMMASTEREPRLFPTDEPGRILVVGAHSQIQRTLVAPLQQAGHTITTTHSGGAALDRATAQTFDMVVLTAQLPDSDGYSICAALKHSPRTWDLPVIIIMPKNRRMAWLHALDHGADACMRLPLSARTLAMRVRVLLRHRRRNAEFERVEDVIFALARTVEAKDSYTEGHLWRMAGYAGAIGERLGLDRETLRALRFGALLHDVGKVGIDEGIIRKVGPLTPAEALVMQQHPIIGERIVEPLRLAGAIAPIVRHHHERWDGAGYPDGLSGEQIPLCARIVAVADAFDAMTTQRPYNRVLTVPEACASLRAGAARQWDPRIVAVFLDWMQSQGIETNWS